MCRIQGRYSLVLVSKNHKLDSINLILNKGYQAVKDARSYSDKGEKDEEGSQQGGIQGR